MFSGQLSVAKLSPGDPFTGTTHLQDHPLETVMLLLKPAAILFYKQCSFNCSEFSCQNTYDQ